MNKLISKGEQEFLGQVNKVSEGGFGENKRILLDTQIAQIHNIENKHVRESIKNLIKKGRFIENVDYIDIKQGVDVIDDDLLNDICSKQVILQARNIFILSYSGYAKLLNNFTFNTQDGIEYFIQEYFQLSELPIIMYTDKRREIKFLDELEVILEAFKLKGIRQFSCCDNKYKIDYYIPKLRLAIEYDEEYHGTKLQQLSDKQRQEEIQDTLECEFIRLNSDVSNSENIKIVIQHLLQPIQDCLICMEKKSLSYCERETVVHNLFYFLSEIGLETEYINSFKEEIN